MKIIYLVLPCYNEEDVLHDSIKKLSELMHGLVQSSKIDSKSKVVFVDDGSVDATWKILEEICEQDAMFGAISLAHNSGHQNALLAGMMSVIEMCDAVITLDADLQHDINVIPEFVNKLEEGYEIVCGVRKSRKGESFFKRITGDAFYEVMRFSGAKVIKNHADYRLMSAKAIKALQRYDEANLFLRGIIPQIGYKNTIIEYEEMPRLAGKSKYSIKKMVKLAMNGITSFSVRPLHLITACGFFFFLFSVVMLIYALVVFCQDGTVPGWTSVVAPIWLLGGVQLLALGVVGEYIGKIYMETKHRPKYEIDKVILK